MTCTEAQADAWLSADLAAVEERVNRYVKVPLTQDQFDVLVSFDFNTGALPGSTLLRKLNDGDYDAVPVELMRWVHDHGDVIPGLVNRRKDECRVWNRSAATPAIPSAGTAVIVAGAGSAATMAAAANGVPAWAVGVGVVALVAATIGGVIWWRSRTP